MRKSDGTEIFGLTLLDVYECPYCNDIHSDWYALVFDTETKKPRFGVCQCTDSESVEDSPFRGYPLSDIVGHIFDMGFIY